MANDITLTSSVRKNLLSLQNTTNLLDKTSERLSTGKKVNSALDNPSSFFTARGLNNRANDLSGRKDGIGQAISLLEATDKSLSALTQLVEQAKSIAQQAEDAATSGTSTVSSAAFTDSEAISITSTALASGDTFGISVNGGTTTVITIVSGDTAVGLASRISAADSSIDATYNTTSNTIDITAASGVRLQLIDGTGTPLADFLNFNGDAGDVDVTFGPSGSAAEVSSLNTDFQTVLEQINTLLDDASYKGKNLLKGSDTLDVKFNEDGTSKLTLTGVDYTIDGTNTALFSLDTNGYDFQNGGIATALSDTATAIDTLRQQSATFGTSLGIIQTREEFTTNLVNALEDGAGKLVNANLEEESANLLSLQTRQALGVQSLSIANQSQQSVLALFR